MSAWRDVRCRMVGRRAGRRTLVLRTLDREARTATESQERYTGWLREMMRKYGVRTSNARRNALLWRSLES